MSWRCLLPSSWEDVFKTSSRRLIKTNIFALALGLQKTPSRRLQDVLVKTNIFVLAIRLQDVFKTFSRRLQDVLQKGLQDVFNTSSRHPQDVFKTYHQVKLFLLTPLWEAFNTFLRRFFPKTIIYRGICLGNTTSDKFMASVQNLQEK